MRHFGVLLRFHSMNGSIFLSSRALLKRIQRQLQSSPFFRSSFLLLKKRKFPARDGKERRNITRNNTIPRYAANEEKVRSLPPDWLSKRAHWLVSSLQSPCSCLFLWRVKRESGRGGGEEVLKGWGGREENEGFGFAWNCMLRSPHPCIVTHDFLTRLVMRKWKLRRLSLYSTKKSYAVDSLNVSVHSGLSKPPSPR